MTMDNERMRLVAMGRRTLILEQKDNGKSQNSPGGEVVMKRGTTLKLKLNKPLEVSEAKPKLYSKQLTMSRCCPEGLLKPQNAYKALVSMQIDPLSSKTHFIPVTLLRKVNGPLSYIHKSTQV